jgi:hypothetical protein
VTSPIIAATDIRVTSSIIAASATVIAAIAICIIG